MGHYGRHASEMWANLGSFGVDIFFVLSGFIITERLLEERERSSTISLRSFYFRRAFRILPIVVVYLLFLILLSLSVNLVDFHFTELLGSIFFFRNYQVASSAGGVYTGHFWSLSIEEHFYLLWPALLLWLGNRRAVWVTLLGALTIAAWRIFELSHLGARFPSSVIYRTDARLDGLLLGSAMALLLRTPKVRGFVFRNFPKETPLFAAFLLLFNLQRTNGLPSLTTYLLLCIAIGSTVVVEEGLVHKWLNGRLLVWIGTISYSLYVWQEPFTMRPRPDLTPLGRASLFPYQLFCVFALASASYYLLERPMIRLGKNWERTASNHQVRATT